MGRFTWRDILLIGGAFVAYGAAQTQLITDSRRLDRLESSGSPQVQELRVAIAEMLKRLDHENDGEERRIAALEAALTSAIRTSDAFNATATERLLSIGHRVDGLVTANGSHADLDKRLAVNERLLADLNIRIDGALRQNEIMLRDILNDLARSRKSGGP